MTVALWSGVDFVGRMLQYAANGATGFGVEPKKMLESNTKLQ
jgi:hypothetical protein